jgi:ankyrin repeat protein
VAPAPAAPSPELLRLLRLQAGAAAPAVRAALNKKDWAGALPIHNALRAAATGPELVRAMLDAGGEAMLGVPAGNYKFLPLHLAAIHSPSPAVVALLLARGPAGSARAEGENGSTPLDLAACNTGPVVEEIAALLRAAM